MDDLLETIPIIKQQTHGVFTAIIWTWTWNHLLGARRTVDTKWFVQGKNQYYAQDGKTYIADLCALVDKRRKKKRDRNSSGYGWKRKRKKISNRMHKYECHMDDTNWRLKYKRSYVSRKEKGRGKAWWKRTRRRRMRYEHQFPPLKEEFYEDNNESEESDDSDDVLSSCFVYEMECSLSNSICFGSPSMMTSFILSIPFECEGEVSMPQINHALDWSDMQHAEVVYDQQNNQLGIAMETSAVSTLGKRTEFTLCFEKKELNAYNMVLSTWKAQGQNQFYSLDGAVYVPDICQITD
eukprot:977287_1